VHIGEVQDAMRLGPSFQDGWELLAPLTPDSLRSSRPSPAKGGD